MTPKINVVKLRKNQGLPNVAVASSYTNYYRYVINRVGIDKEIHGFPKKCI